MAASTTGTGYAYTVTLAAATDFVLGPSSTPVSPFSASMSILSFVMHSATATDTYITVDGTAFGNAVPGLPNLGAYCLVGVAGAMIKVPVGGYGYSVELGTRSAPVITMISSSTPTITIQAIG